MKKPAPKTGTEIARSMKDKQGEAITKARAAKRAQMAAKDIPAAFLDWHAPTRSR